jgi:PAS domain S-box-containing protein
MPGSAGEKARWGMWRWGGRHAWVALLGFGVVLGCVYFLAARLGLALLSKAESVAVFWPASGVATGALMVLGRRARVWVAIAIVGATIAANLLSDRGMLTAVAFGLCNAGEALLAAWLVDRWSGWPFKFDELRGLWGFLGAAALASAVAAAGAAVAMHQLHAVPHLPSIWRVWAASDGLGIVTTAPLVIGLYHLASERPPRNETVEGLAALALLAATSATVYVAPAGSWFPQVPPAVLFPLLLWIAARCRPVFAAAAAFIISGALFGAAILRLGPFALTDVPVPSVQVTILIASLCALTLSALFAERRRSEAALMESNDRLQLALGGAQLGVWSADLTTGALACDERHCRINGHDPAAPPRTLGHARALVHPEDLPRLDAAFAVARRTGAPCQAEYRIGADGNRDPSQVRWVAVEGTVVRDAVGQPVRLLGVTRDITGRKRAEEQKDLLLAELDHRVKNVLAVVAAVASRTQQTSGSVADFVEALDGRIKSMAGTHELLSGRKWEGLLLRDLIERELEPYATGDTVRVDGPDVMLRAEAGQPLAMVLHELVTNAAKYGALSAEGGRVSVRWALAPANGSGAALALEWVESGGPDVAAEVRPGYGTSVIRDLVPYELGGKVDLKLVRDGVRCRLQVPARWLSAGDPPCHGLDGSDASSMATGRMDADDRVNGTGIDRDATHDRTSSRAGV